MTTDLVCGPFVWRFLYQMIVDDCGPDFCQYYSAIAFGFSRPANKAIITEVVEKDETGTQCSYLELVLQVVSVSSPVFLS